MNLVKPVLLAFFVALALAGCKSDGSDTAPPPAAATPTPTASAASVSGEEGDALVRSNAIKVTAIVEAIDHTTRQVTLRGPDGTLESFTVGDQVRNLAQVKQGDTVELTYLQSIAVAVRQPGEVTPGVSAASGTERAAVGAAPGAVTARTTTIVATVRALDREKSTATLEGADGQLQTIAVRDPRHFDRTKVGDLVEITLTEALAVSVEKTGAR